MAQFVSKYSGCKSFCPLTQSQTMLLLYGSVSVKTIAQVRLNHSAPEETGFTSTDCFFLGGSGLPSAVDHRQIHYNSTEENSGRLSAHMKSEAKSECRCRYFQSFPYFISHQCSLQHLIKPQQSQGQCRKCSYYSYCYQIPKIPLRSGVRNATFWRFKMRYQICKRSNFMAGHWRIYTAI